MRKEEKGQNPRFGTVNFERRKHPRIAVNLPVAYWKFNETGIRAGCTGDISEGGILLYLPENIAVGQNIGVKISISTGFGSKSIEALGQAA